MSFAKTPPAPPPPQSPPEPPEERTVRRTAVFSAADEGRHGEANAMAVTWEQEALRAGGPTSPDAVHWLEVRAELARRAGDSALSCRLWLYAASSRLQSGQDPASPEVSGAVDRAHHCWHQVTEVPAARELGAALVGLRERAPGARPGALEDVRLRMASLDGGRPQETTGG
ncbi:hypothetical protein HCC30_21520 [Streptomyces sp. HNM0574]|nr:hypothetical protein [Streptomyces sp. HNM0574]